jgi:hypothetical protein
MNFIVYFFVALIAAFGVLFGLDRVSAPMSPMPPSKYEIRAAVPPPAPAPVVAEAKPETKPDAKPEATPLAKPEAKRAAAPKVVTPSPVAQAPVPLYPADQQPASIVAAEPGVAATSPPAAPKCNVEVCANAYRSFTAADCTYQPSEGPRRLCTKGLPPPTVVAPAPQATPATTASGAAASGAAVPEARAQACNVAACSRSYPRSFTAADCTFQPSEGPRRVCAK